MAFNTLLSVTFHVVPPRCDIFAMFLSSVLTSVLTSFENNFSVSPSRFCHWLVLPVKYIQDILDQWMMLGRPNRLPFAMLPTSSACSEFSLPSSCRQHTQQRLTAVPTNEKEVGPPLLLSFKGTLQGFWRVTFEGSPFKASEPLTGYPSSPSMKGGLQGSPFKPKLKGKGLEWCLEGGGERHEGEALKFSSRLEGGEERRERRGGEEEGGGVRCTFRFRPFWVVAFKSKFCLLNVFVHFPMFYLIYKFYEGFHPFWVFFEFFCF